MRFHGIDASRLAMAFLVVVLHSFPSGLAPEDNMVKLVGGIVCRCAVPFFLITTGFFLKIPGRFTTDIVTKPFLRLFPIYLFWMVVFYSAAPFLRGNPPMPSIRDLLSGGVAFHLWYLPAVGLAIVTVTLGVKLLGDRLTALLCAGLASLTLALGAYHDVLHLPGTPLQGRTMMAPMYVFIGYWIARNRIAPNLLVAAGIAMIGLALMLGEETWIAYATRPGDPVGHDFTIGTFAYGTGAFLVARALPQAVGHRFGQLGQYALGVYLAHPLFLWLLIFLFGKATLIAMLWRIPVEFAGALAVTFVLRQIPYLKRTVA